MAVGAIDHPEPSEPKLEMFTKRRLHWTKPLEVAQFPGMPTGG